MCKWEIKFDQLHIYVYIFLYEYHVESERFKRAEKYNLANFSNEKEYLRKNYVSFKFIAKLFFKEDRKGNMKRDMRRYETVLGFLNEMLSTYDVVITPFCNDLRLIDYCILYLNKLYIKNIYVKNERFEC